MMDGSYSRSRSCRDASWPVIRCAAGSHVGLLGPFWAIPTETLPENVAGSAMGLVNALGNLGGFFGPLAVGYLNQRTGGFVYPFALLSLGYLVGAALAFLFLPRRKLTPETA